MAAHTCERAMLGPLVFTTGVLPRAHVASSIDNAGGRAGVPRTASGGRQARAARASAKLRRPPSTGARRARCGASTWLKARAENARAGEPTPWRAAPHSVSLRGPRRSLLLGPGKLVVCCRALGWTAGRLDLSEKILAGAGVREKLVQMIQCVTISHQCWRRDRSDTGWCTCLAAKWHALRLAAASISRWSQGPKLDSSPHRSLQHYSCTLAALREPQPG